MDDLGLELSLSWLEADGCSSTDFKRMQSVVSALGFPYRKHIAMQVGEGLGPLWRWVESAKDDFSVD